jgi:hypothetical protein
MRQLVRLPIIRDLEKARTCFEVPIGPVLGSDHVWLPEEYIAILEAVTSAVAYRVLL